jgi:hypothetical protein
MRVPSHWGYCEFRSWGLDFLQELDRFESARTAIGLAVMSQESRDAPSQRSDFLAVP